MWTIFFTEGPVTDFESADRFPTRQVPPAVKFPVNVLAEGALPHTPAVQALKPILSAF